MSEEKEEKKVKKKYVWLKLQEGFFRDKRIKKLRRIAGGDTHTIIYLKMQLLSLKEEGIILYEGVEDNLAEEIALEIDEDVENVKITIAYLMSNGLLEEVDVDRYLLPEAAKNIGKEGSSAERVRRHRAKKAQESLPKPDEIKALPVVENEVLHCNADVTKGNTEKEKEKEEEKEEEKETDKQTEKEQLPLSPSEMERVELLKDLFEGWSVNDHQINHLSWVVSDKLRYRMGEAPDQRGMRIYDAMQHLTLKAKASNVEYIYGWLLKVIPNEDLGEW